MKKIMHLVMISCLFLLALSLSSCASPTGGSNLQQGQSAAETNNNEPRMWGPWKFVKNTVGKIQNGLSPLNKGAEAKEDNPGVAENNSLQEEVIAERSSAAPVRIYAESKKKILGKKESKAPAMTERKTAIDRKDVAVNNNVKSEKDPGEEPKRKIIGEGISSKSPGPVGWYMYQVENSPLSPMRKGGPGLPQPVKDAMSMQGMKVD